MDEPMQQRHRRRRASRATRRVATMLAVPCACLLAGGASAGGEGAMWTPSAENTDGLKITLASSTVVGSPATAIRACFVLSNTNSPPGGALGTGATPANARVSASDVAGSGLPFYFSSPIEVDVGAMDVTCGTALGGTAATLVPVAPVFGSGVIPAGRATQKCCFLVQAPPPPGPALGEPALMSLTEALAGALGAPACDPAYPECVPGNGDEVVYTLQSDSGMETETETVFIWTLSGPGCGLIGIEAVAALVLARRLRPRPTGGRRP